VVPHSILLEAAVELALKGRQANVICRYVSAFWPGPWARAAFQHGG
jgi:hypothetical protein